MIEGTSAEWEADLKFRLPIYPAMSVSPPVRAPPCEPADHDNSQEIYQFRCAPPHRARGANVHVALAFTEHEQHGPRQTYEDK